MKSNNVLRRLVCAFALMLAASAGVQAQGYPNKPVRLVVGFAPGGATDIVARQISNELGAALGQPIIIENRGGGNGYPAWNQVARAPADGYTLLLGENSMAIMPGLYRQQSFDPGRDLAPVAFLGTAPFVLVVHPSVKANNVKEFVALSKSQPGRVQYGSAGNGTPTQLSFEVLKLETNIDALHVPYKGGGPAMVDLLGGHIQSMFAAFSVAKPQIEQGKVRAIALTGPRRSPVFPDLSTFSESGVPLHDLDLGQWWGVFAPVGTPADVIARVNQAFGEVLARPEIRAKLAALSIEVETGPPSLLSTRFSAELARWPKVIQKAKVVGD